MSAINLGKEFLHELLAEVPATRKCLERIPMELFGYKPHEKSMALGYLAVLVAEMPQWITMMVEQSAIDFATYSHFQPETTAQLVGHFDENVARASNALEQLSNDDLAKTFSLKRNGEVVFSSSTKESIASTLNHWVHHRGQLTVYMRLNDIPVPSIYGPSADDRGF